MKKILVTGANGQLGNEMRLLAEEHKNFEYFFTDVAELDICDEQAVMDFVSTHQIDVIVNCAAYTAVDKAEDNVELCDKLNHVAPGYLAKAAQSRNGWLVQVSTDYVFDGTAHIPYKEEDTPCPNSVYGSTKLAGEQEALKQCPNTMVIRTAWLYSTFGNNSLGAGERDFGSYLRPDWYADLCTRFGSGHFCGSGEGYRAGYLSFQQRRSLLLV